MIQFFFSFLFKLFVFQQPFLIPPPPYPTYGHILRCQLMIESKVLWSPLKLSASRNYSIKRGKKRRRHEFLVTTKHYEVRTKTFLYCFDFEGMSLYHSDDPETYKGCTSLPDLFPVLMCTTPLFFHLGRLIGGLRFGLTKDRTRCDIQTGEILNSRTGGTGDVSITTRLRLSSVLHIKREKRGTMRYRRTEWIRLR